KEILRMPGSVTEVGVPDTWIEALIDEIRKVHALRIASLYLRQALDYGVGRDRLERAKSIEDLRIIVEGAQRRYRSIIPSKPETAQAAQSEVVSATGTI